MMFISIKKMKKELKKDMGIPLSAFCWIRVIGKSLTADSTVYSAGRLEMGMRNRNCAPLAFGLLTAAWRFRLQPSARFTQILRRHTVCGTAKLRHAANVSGNNRPCPSRGCADKGMMYLLKESRRTLRLSPYHSFIGMTGILDSIISALLSTGSVTLRVARKMKEGRCRQPWPDGPLTPPCRFRYAPSARSIQIARVYESGNRQLQHGGNVEQSRYAAVGPG
jgi:hypothetical protein